MQRDLFDTQMEIGDQLIDQQSPAHANAPHRLIDGHTIRMNDNYTVRFDLYHKDHLVIGFPMEYRRCPWARTYTHPNMNRNAPTTLSFKSHTATWKRWKESTGCVIYFAIPVKHIDVPQREKGNSYPHIMIGGTLIVLYASGGGLHKWTDIVDHGTNTLANHPRTLVDHVAKYAEPGHEPWTTLYERRDLFLEANKDKLIVVSASRHDDMNGYVLCHATVGGQGSYKDAVENGDMYWVPTEEYTSTPENPKAGTVIDPERHMRAMQLSHESLDPIREWMKANHKQDVNARWNWLQDHIRELEERGDKPSTHWQDLACTVLSLR